MPRVVFYFLAFIILTSCSVEESEMRVSVMHLLLGQEEYRKSHVLLIGYLKKSHDGVWLLYSAKEAADLLDRSRSIFVDVNRAPTAISPSLCDGSFVQMHATFDYGEGLLGSTLIVRDIRGVIKLTPGQGGSPVGCDAIPVDG